MNSKERKRFILLLGLLAMIGPFNIDTCLPALTQISNELGVTFQRVEISMSIFFLGFGIGQLFGGYFSDIKGRKWIVSLGLIISIVGSIVLIFTPSIEVFYIFRAFQGLGAGCVGVSVAAIVRDNFEGNEAASVMSLVMMIAMGAPLIAPSIGATFLHFSTWNSIFIFIALYGIITLIFLQLRLENVIPPKESRHSFFKGIKRVYSNKPALGYMAAMAIPSGALYTYLTTAPFIYQEFFNIPEKQFAILFGVNGLSLIIMNKLNSKLVLKHSPKRMLNIGLTIHISTLVILLISLLLFKPNFYFILPMITLHVSTLGFISGNATTIALEKFDKSLAGLANSQMRVVGIIVGSLAGATASTLNNGTLFPPIIVMMFCSLLGISLYIFLERKHKVAV
ncbi:multidrug effflux MFS transporter [Flammeovirga kamogawensis]|uniref:Multidrug effflux MFS transporter n=1 Tax=Flammeovirga kamogawensis TaxID=373891 RepID=A0ABX8H0K9_9BACT|nr:multidrug effflux MFS transporter [Flammeovirga kamogawensis]MBB6462168.1 DHA1 family bicyclomycin/chloramphenicol resistance-like MFS transporter [Flammeovirga kamogawensis]QWG09429.1 multidrug effflux MFS transporter [Flammeovirga kamogawensis]TRX64947.1 multidrug effflux MFS transporter [Flammeovirga kamogawensis]